MVLFAKIKFPWFKSLVHLSGNTKMPNVNFHVRHSNNVLSYSILIFNKKLCRTKAFSLNLSNLPKKACHNQIKLICELFQKHNTRVKAVRMNHKQIPYT